MDYGHCNVTCIRNKLKRKNIEIPGIVRGGLRFTLPLILPDFTSNHPDASKLNISTITYNLVPFKAIPWFSGNNYGILMPRSRFESASGHHQAFGLHIFISGSVGVEVTREFWSSCPCNTMVL